MKKTIISLAAASLVASSAMAADRGVDFTTTGQAVLYYNTANASLSDAVKLDKANSKANFAIQLNNNADLKNGFGLGTQISYLGTLGLEKNVVNATMEGAGTTNSTFYLSKLYLTKVAGKTTVKLGRQELPKSLSPLAFSEGWNVFKNTFDAAVVINSDIPNVTLVGAYVGSSNKHASMDATSDMLVNNALAVSGGAYMLTAQTTALPMTTLTASLYSLKQVVTAKSAIATWVDAKINPKLPMGVKFAVQTGTISPDAAGLKDTSAFGAKVSAAPMKGLKVIGAFSTVNDGTAKVINVGTGKKTPLYTQMVANQGAINSDNTTFMAKGVYSLGSLGTAIAQASTTTDNSNAKKDFTDMELLYKTKALGMNLLAAYVRTDKDGTKNNIIRFVARYKF